MRATAALSSPPGIPPSRTLEQGCRTPELCSTGEGCDLVRGGSSAPGARTARCGLPERITPMTDDKQTTPDVVSRMAEEFIGQLRAATKRLEDLARFAGPVPPAPGALTLPG